MAVEYYGSPVKIARLSASLVKVSATATFQHFFRAQNPSVIGLGHEICISSFIFSIYRSPYQRKIASKVANTDYFLLFKLKFRFLCVFA